VIPDEMAVFRRARLLVLLDLLAEETPAGVDAERAGVYDFLAAHPLLLVRDDDDPDRFALLMAGFDDRAVAYASPGQRLATAQSHLGRDLTALAATGLVEMVAAGRIRYRATDEGRAAVAALSATYVVSYRMSARIIVRRLRRLSGRRLREAVRLCISPPSDAKDTR
jgi:hypothetical protein